MKRSNQRTTDNSGADCGRLGKNMIFRRLTPSDAPEYRRLRLYGLRESPSAFGSSFEEEAKRALQSYETRMENSDDRWTIGALSGNRLIGVVTLVRDTSRKGSHKAGIFGMYVSPRWRKKGVGRELIGQAIDVAKHLRGLKQLHLAVTSSNRPALSLYDSAGFVSYGEEPRALFVKGRYYSEALLCLKLGAEPVISANGPERPWHTLNDRQKS